MGYYPAIIVNPDESVVLRQGPVAGDSSLHVATTAFVQAAVASGGGGGGTPEPANTVLAGPASGAATAPTFRALAANDIPGTLNTTTVNPDVNGVGLAVVGIPTMAAITIRATGFGAGWIIGQSSADFEIWKSGVGPAIDISGGSLVVGLVSGGTVSTLPLTDNSTNIPNTAWIRTHTLRMVTGALTAAFESLAANPDDFAGALKAALAAVE